MKLSEIIVTNNMVLKSTPVHSNFVLDLPDNWVIIYRLSVDKESGVHLLKVWLSRYKNSFRDKNSVIDLQGNILNSGNCYLGLEHIKEEGLINCVRKFISYCLKRFEHNHYNIKDYL